MKKGRWTLFKSVRNKRFPELVLTNLDDSKKTWLKTATIGGLQAFLSQNGLSSPAILLDQYNQAIQSLNSTPSIPEHNLTVDLDYVESRYIELLKNPKGLSSGTKPLEDDIVQFFYEWQLPGESNSKKLEDSLFLQRRGTLKGDIKNAANTYVFQCKFLLVTACTENKHTEPEELIENVQVLLIKLSNNMLNLPSDTKVRSLLNLAQSSQQTFWDEDGDSDQNNLTKLLYLTTAHKFTDPEVVAGLQERTGLFFRVCTLEDENTNERDTFTAQIKLLSKLGSKLIDGNPLFWSHYRTFNNGVTHSLGKLLFINFVHHNLGLLVKKVKDSNLQEDKNFLAQIAQQLIDSKISIKLLCEQELSLRQHFDIYLQALLSIGRNESRDFALNSYISRIVTSTQNSLITEDFTIILTQHAVQFADRENLEKLVKFGCAQFPNSKKEFTDCLMQRIKDDKEKAKKAQQRTESEQAALEKQKAGLAAREILAKAQVIEQERKEAQLRTDEEAARRLAAAMYAEEGAREVQAVSASSSSSSATSSSSGGFNYEASWNNGQIKANSAGIYKVGTEKNDQYRQYVQLPAELISAFGIQVIDNNFIKRAETALGSQGLKTYKTPDGKEMVVEIKSLSAGDGGDRIYFTQMLRNENGETLYTGAVRGKHNASMPCQQI